MLKAAIFLDHSNVYSHIKKKRELRGHDIDYQKFKEILLKDFISVGVFAFLGVTKPMKKRKENFINYLEEAGYTPILLELVERADGTFVQKGLDILMSHQIDHMIEKFDVAIIISGDADFKVTVKMLRNSFKYVLVWSWKESMSKDLLKAAGKENAFYIDSIWDEIKRKRKSLTIQP
jgi:uncharacterized LabA/DUF88 family protein